MHEAKDVMLGPRVHAHSVRCAVCDRRVGGHLRQALVAVPVRAGEDWEYVPGEPVGALCPSCTEAVRREWLEMPDA
ncbi:MAG TPA: hypothetical protein VNN79_08005 [Actinomycetota bacterium]|nr:hypothetical protein [Actinomycetota bacterium]